MTVVGGIPAGDPFFVVPVLPAAGHHVLDGPEGRHAATVKRLRVGETLVLTDGNGGWLTAAVTQAHKAALTLDCGAPQTSAVNKPRVLIVQALPKGERSELAVDLATEAGVDVLIPWSASRCVARWTADKAARGVQKWQAVAREATKQSRRTRIPEVRELADTPEIAALIRHTTAAGGVALLLHEAEASPMTASALPTTGDIVLVIGPEGGISPEEIATFSAAGARPVRLGPEVLRTSTAGAVALGALGVLTGRWSA